jgi:hypothetical protein
MKVICIKNPTHLTAIKIGGVYEVISKREISVFILLKVEQDIQSYYDRDWFEDISIKRDRIITEILK